MRIAKILCTIALLGLVACGGGSKATTPDPAPPGLETSTSTLSDSDSDALNDEDGDGVVNVDELLTFHIDPEQAPVPTPAARRQPLFRRFEGCSGSGPVNFEHSPMRFEDFSVILPYGLVVGAHVTPIDHMYFAMKDRLLGR
jgi:hypothetical protein